MQRNGSRYVKQRHGVGCCFMELELMCIIVAHGRQLDSGSDFDADIAITFGLANAVPNRVGPTSWRLVSIDLPCGSQNIDSSSCNIYLIPGHW